MVIRRICDHGFYSGVVQTIQGLFLKKQEDPCNTQLNLFFFSLGSAAALFLCVAFQNEDAHVCSQICLLVFFIYVNTYTWGLQQKLASGRPSKSTSISISLFLLTVQFEISENWKGNQSFLIKKQKWKQNQTNQHTHAYTHKHTPTPAPPQKKGEKKTVKIFLLALAVLRYRCYTLKISNRSFSGFNGNHTRSSLLLKIFFSREDASSLQH